MDGITTTQVPAPSAPPRASRARRRVKAVFSPFWVVPALWSASAVVAGFGLPRLDAQITDDLPLLFDGGIDSARTVLSTTAGAMISVTGLVFSITIVVLQLASSQFSPRVLQTFLDDRISQNTLGVFVASFLYALTVLRSLSDTSPVPQTAVTVSFLLVLAAVAMFLAFIHHITQSVAVSTIIHRTGQQTRTLLRRSASRRAELPDEPVELPPLRRQTVVTSPMSGHLNRLDARVLCAIANARDVRIEVLHPLGSFVPEGAPVAVVRGDHDVASEDWSEIVTEGLTLARDRSMEQDLSFGLRRLVDIAERALSPGVNDPTTAVQVIDELHDILRRMVPMAPAAGVHSDGSGTPRVTTAEWTFGQYLDLAVDEIAHWGATSLQIPRRLDEMLSDLQAGATEDVRKLLAAKARSVAARAA